ncbi:MAG: hypothetical protein K9N55_16835 [Phycisphaerae bacterium]|nr:hypothetical protein [Phycisphaerae bacterium]
MSKAKKVSLAVVTILWLAGMCLGQGKAPAKKQGNRAKASAEQQAWQEKLQKMTPEQQEVAKAKRAFETTVAPWRAVRLMAVEEKAVKTLAAIDQVIASKEQQLAKRLATLEAGKAGAKADAKNQADKKAARKTKKPRAAK